jgi:hypothetical protein
MLRRGAGCGYGAQEFISAGPESLKIWLARAGNRNDSAGKKGGHHSGPPFFIYAASGAAQVAECTFLLLRTALHVAVRHAFLHAKILAVRRCTNLLETNILTRLLLRKGGRGHNQDAKRCNDRYDLQHSCFPQ